MKLKNLTSSALRKLKTVLVSTPLKTLFFYRHHYRIFHILGLIVPALVFNWLLFRPFKVVQITNYQINKETTVDTSEINNNFLNSFIADIIQTSLNIGQYKVCFENLGVTKINSLQSPLLVMMQNPTSTTLSIPINQKQCVLIDANNGTPVLKFTIAAMASVEQLEATETQVTSSTFRWSMEFKWTKLRITLENTVWYALIKKLIVVSIIWISLFFLVGDLINLLKKPLL